LTRGDCWKRIRYLRKTPELAALAKPQPGRSTKSKSAGPIRRSTGTRWTQADDDRLLDLAGYEPVHKIAHRLGRSVPAVRFRLGALGMSAKVTDGWSLRALRRLLCVSTFRLRYFIGNDLLRVRDARISRSSLAAFCERNRRYLDSTALERAASALLKGDDEISWERVAGLLNVAVVEVQRLIFTGELKLTDTFVTDRSFEEFCKKHGDQINIALLDPATARWLVSEYGVSQSAANAPAVSRAQKHVLVVRTCSCGTKIAGNAYFRHIRMCRSVAATTAQHPVQASVGCFRHQSSVRDAVFTGSSTYESASRRQSSKDG
jgi:hypothetical protein